MFYDGTDPRWYRHAVLDWLAYQNRCTEGQFDYMSHEKRLRALVIGIRGRMRLRLDNFVRAIPSSPPPELFNLLVDHLLHVVDPIDRHTDFLATAEAWKNLVCTRAKPGQSLAQFWLRFTDASVQYTQLHGDVAGTVGCQELIALTCLHNVGLPRGEFNRALQDALRWQEGANKARQTGNLTKILKGGSVATYPSFPPTSSEAARSSKSASSKRVEPMTTTEDGGGSGSTTKKKIDVIAFETALLDLTQQLQDMARVADKLQETLNEALEAALENLQGDLNQSRSVLNRMKCHLDLAVTANETLLAEMPKVKEAVKESRAAETKGKEDPFSVHSSRKPLVTLDAVRVALRALEAGKRRQKGTATRIRTGVTRRSEQTTRYMKLKCFECGQAGQKWWQKPHSKRNYDKRKEEEEKEDTSAGNSLAQAEERGSTASRLASTTNRLCDDTTRTTLMDASKSESLHPIIAGGAKRSVIGLPEYVKICKELSISPKVHPKHAVDPEFHAFGINENYSERQRVAGRVNIPIPYGRGRAIIAVLLAVDGNALPLIGKDLLREWRAEEYHAGDRINLAWKGEKISLRTYIDETGHARLPLSREAMQMNIAESMLFTCLSDAKEHFSREESIELLKRIHSRTHAHWTTVKILLERNRQWHPGMLPVLKDISKNCAVCIRTGDPQPSTKISLSRLHMGFND